MLANLLFSVSNKHHPAPFCYERNYRTNRILASTLVMRFRLHFDCISSISTRLRLKGQVIYCWNQAKPLNWCPSSSWPDLGTQKSNTYFLFLLMNSNFNAAIFTFLGIFYTFLLFSDYLRFWNNYEIHESGSKMAAIGTLWRIWQVIWCHSPMWHKSHWTYYTPSKFHCHCL